MNSRDHTRLQILIKQSIRASREALEILDDLAVDPTPRPFRPVSPDRDSRVNFYPSAIPNSGFEKPSRANRRHKRRFNR